MDPRGKQQLFHTQGKLVSCSTYKTTTDSVLVLGRPILSAPILELELSLFRLTEQITSATPLVGSQKCCFNVLYFPL